MKRIKSKFRDSTELIISSLQEMVSLAKQDYTLAPAIIREARELYVTLFGKAQPDNLTVVNNTTQTLHIAMTPEEIQACAQKYLAS